MNELRVTPLHARTAELNARNAWSERNGMTLAADFGDVAGEALAARVSVVMADISWRWRVSLEGSRAPEALSRLFTRDVGATSAGTGLKTLWLNDAGAVRGAGLVARLADARVLLAASAPDREWIFRAASVFDVEARDVTGQSAGIAVIGPYAGQLLAAAGIDPALDQLAFRNESWRGVSITLSRWGEHAGYEIWCDAPDATMVWDRLAKAGAPFALRPAGLAAMDILDCERGVARPGRDYQPATDGHAAEPRPRSLGLERLIDESHLEFNGRVAWQAAREKAGRALVGLVFDSDIAAPHVPLVRFGAVVGRTLGSVTSPALRRAIALAQVEDKWSAPGTALTVSLPTSAEAPAVQSCVAHVVDLPFLPNPDPIPA